MGNIAATAAKNMSANMTEKQREMAMAQRELQLAMQIAKMRDDFWWLVSMQGTMATFLVLGAAKTHNPKLLGPLIPFGFSASYFYDAAYGQKMERLQRNAVDVLRHERERFVPPEGNRLITADDYRRLMGLPALNMPAAIAALRQ